jgi:hypothetical protein
MTTPNPREIEALAERLTPLQASVLKDCCKRGSTRANDGGLVDDLLSGLCSTEGIKNGWLVTWSMNPKSREDGYMSLYTPTPCGLAVIAHLERTSSNV